MEFAEWQPYYEQILKDFGFDRRKDEEAAEMLSHLLPPGRSTPSQIRGIIGDQVVTVLGNGPRLAEETHLVQGRVIAADEAVAVASSMGLTPDVVVTDLDGRIEDLLAANANGAFAVIHAHGDNMEALERWAGSFSSQSLGTTQSRPFAQIYNFGGFTDGDRAVFLAEHFGASQIRLLGFDFETPNPKDYPADIKRKKLVWAKRLIRVLKQRSAIVFPALSSSE